MIIKTNLKTFAIGLVPLLFLLGCQPTVEPVPIEGETGVNPVTETDQSRSEAVEQMEQAAARAIAAETRAPTGALSSTAELEGEETPMPEPTTLADLLPDLGAAPELTNEIWINSEPLTMEALQGKVVLIEFWTFG